MFTTQQKIMYYEKFIKRNNIGQVSNNFKINCLNGTAQTG